MKTSKITRTLLAAVLLSGTGSRLLGQDATVICPSGNQPGYRGPGAGQGRGPGAGHGMGQCARRGQCDGTGPQNAANTCPLGQAGQPAGGITTTDANNILFMKQEEKLARDVYLALSEKWDHATFAHITVSEQRHMDAVDGLIQRFSLTDTTPEAAGAFTIPELQALYDELLAEGGKSLAAALKVGVLIEETDIEDLDEALAATQDPTVTRVMTNLRRGSANHLAAFNRAIAALEAPGTATAGPAGKGPGGRQGGKLQPGNGSRMRGGR
jgi:hypothetical protein